MESRLTRLLLNDKFGPITNSIGFLDVNKDIFLKGILEWYISIGLIEKVRYINVDFESTIKELLPLVTPVNSKTLLIPTNSKWTAVLDNGRLGSDVSGTISVLSGLLKCIGVKATAVHHTMPSKVRRETRGRWGATILEVYKNGKNIRTIYVGNDGGRWSFFESGEPFAFENMEGYKARKTRDRFTPEKLSQHLKEFGIDIFNDQFYLPENDNTSILIERTNMNPRNYKEYSLEQIRYEIGER